RQAGRWYAARLSAPRDRRASVPALLCPGRRHRGQRRPARQWAAAYRPGPSRGREPGTHYRDNGRPRALAERRARGNPGTRGWKNEMNKSEQIRHMSTRELALFGMQDVAYVKRAVGNDELGYAVHAADRPQIALC